MIRGFRHKGLQRLYEDGDPRGVRADQRRRIERVLTLLDRARGPESLAVAGLHLHELRGQLQGAWSVRVSGNWRIVFRFAPGGVTDVDLVDYH